MMEKEYKVNYNIEDYKYIHDLVYAYKLNKDSIAAHKLIECFKDFIHRYLFLFKHGKYNMEHYSIKSFIKLFIDNKSVKKQINCYKIKGTVQMAIEGVISKLNTLFANYNEHDIEQDLAIILLNMANNYKDTKPSFHTYVLRNYHYYVYRYYEKQLKDPLTASSNSKYLSSEYFTIDSQIECKSSVDDMEDVLNELECFYSVKNKKAVKTKSHSIYDNGFVRDINWINGITCSSIFSILTSFERKVIVMWYIDKMTDSQIANEFGVCRITINKKRAKIRNKLIEEAVKRKIYNIQTKEFKKSGN